MSRGCLAWQKLDVLLFACRKVLSRKKDRSDFIKEAIYSVLLERRKAGIREQMRQGYLEMAQINLTLAKDLCHAEEEATICYEKKLGWSVVGYEY